MTLTLTLTLIAIGKGADEIFGGYLYFHKAPNAREFHEETVRKMKDLYMFDCLRANKSTMAWGLEARVPFLDQQFIELAMSIAKRWSALLLLSTAPCVTPCMVRADVHTFARLDLARTRSIRALAVAAPPQPALRSKCRFP